MARDAFLRYPAVQRALIALVTAVAALGVGAATASADSAAPGNPVPYVIGPGFDANALASTGADPRSGTAVQAVQFGPASAGRQVTAEQSVVVG